MMEAFLTLDYELFLSSQTGSQCACIIQPMNRLLEIADKHCVKMVVFVDAAYLLRLYQIRKNNSYAADCYEEISTNIKTLDEKGHDVEMHFHPQWLFSEMDGAEWKMDLKHYKLSDVPDVENLFIEAKGLLDSLLKKPTIAYRAGGYSIQTYKSYPDLFKKAGILCDSSVLRGHSSFSQYQYYDYSIIPAKHFYRFEDDVCVESDNGPFKEVSISSVEMNGLFYLLYRLYCKIYLRNDFVFGDGKPVGGGRSIPLFKKRKISVSIDHLSAPLLNWFLRKCKDDDTVVLIGHPKNVSPKSLKILDSFLMHNRKGLVFKTMREVL